MDSRPDTADQAPAPSAADGFPDAPSQQVAVQLPNTKPIVTYIILALTILIWLGQMFMLRLTPDRIDWLSAFGIKANEFIRQGELWRLLTPVFLHSTGNIMHIGFNMYFLYVVGARTERLFGHLRFTLLYLLSGMCGVALSFIFTPSFSLGASGALFGLLGAEAMFIWLNREWIRSWNESLRDIGITVAINTVFGLAINVDHFGHFGGLLGGLVFTWFAGPQLKVVFTAPSQAHFQDARSGWRAAIAGTLAAGLFFALLTWIGFTWGVPGVERSF